MKIKKLISEILKYTVIGAVAIFISFLFPNHTKFKYNYKQTQKWNYDDLVAPFDYPIVKNEGVFELEKKAITDNFIPFYSYKKGIAQNFLVALDKVIADNKVDNPSSLISEVQKLFSDGIIKLENQHQNTASVNLVNGNITKEVIISDLHSKSDLVNLIASRTNNAQAFKKLVESSDVYNVVYDDVLSKKFLDSEFQSISAYNGKVGKGELIVERGEIISNDVFQKLRSYEMAFQENISGDKKYIWVFVGYFILTILIIAVLLIYLHFHFPKIFQNWVKLSFILMWLALFAYLVYAVENISTLSTYMIPFCIIPIIIKNFYDDRLALFVHIVVVLIASFLSVLGYEFTFMQIFAGIVTVLLVEETRQWNKFFSAIIFIFFAYSLSYIGLGLIKEGDFIHIDWSVFISLIINAVLTLLAYPFIPLIERIFGFTSSISLAELNDMNQPLLKELSIKAPGTMQHSLQVANLSEAAADVIGANALLVKTGAMYHDIGKMIEPQFFIENQNAQSPHDQLNNFESAKKIIDHVTEGEKMGKKAKLPQLIIDFIMTHHGTTRVEYFYRKQKNDFPQKSFDESLFKYPGPKPKTKEQTILMLADSLEAACKSLVNPTGKDVDEMVNKIINHKLELGQLDDSELNFDELEKCKTVFSNMLRSIHHVRIEYPEEEN